MNGKPAELGQRVTCADLISIDSRSLRLPSRRHKPRVLAYYKPVGEVCTYNDEKGRPTVFEKLPAPGKARWVGIGRLDFNTTGLLLFTTDGELANRLMHPSGGIEREYAVRIRGRATDTQLNALLRGVELEDGRAAFSDIVEAGGRRVNHWYYVVISEGRHHEVRRLWKSQGLEVTRLIRTRFGTCLLPRDRRPGQYWYLQEDELAALASAVNYSLAQ